MSVARYDEGSEMDEQKGTDQPEQEQEPKQPGDLEVPDEQADAVKGGDRNTDFEEKFGKPRP